MCLCISQIQSGFTMLFHDMFHDVFVYESGLGCLISFDPDMFHDMFVYESGLGCLISFDPDLFHDMFVFESGLRRAQGTPNEALTLQDPL
jgi:hypothetical protein